MPKKPLAFALLLTLASAVPAQWRYSSHTDQMTDSQVWRATARSVNSVRFGPPYGGGTVAELTLRPSLEDGAEILLRVNRGQFLCHSRECVIRVRFDDGEALDYGGAPPADLSSDAVFIGSEELFLQRIRTANRVRIEATFFQEGARVFEFKTADLRWPPGPPSSARPTQRVSK